MFEGTVDPLANVPVHLGPWRPRAQPGLMIGEQTRRGRCLVTILDVVELAVSVVEPWEHALLVLCDGSRSVAELIDLQSGRSPAEVQASLEFFGRRGLLSNPRAAPERSESRSLAEIRLARLEWDNEPEQTGQIWQARKAAPFVDLLEPEQGTTSAQVVCASVFADQD